MRPDESVVTGRRHLLEGLASIGASLLLPVSATPVEPIPRKRPSHLKLSLAAYCYRSYLHVEKKSMDLFDFVNLAADLGVDAVELTSYYFPDSVDNDYLHRLQQHAFLQGLDVSGIGVINDFCLPNGPEARAQVEHVGHWIERAAELHAPMVRMLSGNRIQGTADEKLEQRVICRVRQLLPYARQQGVMLALENHSGGVTSTAGRLLSIVKAIQSTHLGVSLDTGNFHGRDPYAELAKVAPYAVNVQVKTEFRRQDESKEPADLAKKIAILRQAKYSGYVVLEYNASEDAKQVVPRYVEELRQLIS